MAAVAAQKPTCAYRVDLGEITSHNIKQLKRLNQHIFPITYNEKFYKVCSYFDKLYFYIRQAAYIVFKLLS